MVKLGVPCERHAPVSPFFPETGRAKVDLGSDWASNAKLRALTLSLAERKRRVPNRWIEWRIT